MSRSTTYCWAWKLTLTDDTVFGFTDHDRGLTIDGVDYEAAAGLSPNTDNVKGVLTSDRITAEDIAAGRFDSAVLQSYRVNWEDVSDRTLVSTGTLGDIRTNGAAFEAAWNPLSAALGRSTGRVFSRICDAALGDARCGLKADEFPDGTTCPRTFAACKTFSNTANYRGFPYLLGDDALTKAPHAGENFDGGSRYDTN